MIYTKTVYINFLVLYKFYDYQMINAILQAGHILLMGKK